MGLLNKKAQARNNNLLLMIVIVGALVLFARGGFPGAAPDVPVTEPVIAPPAVCSDTPTTSLDMRIRNSLNSTGEDYIAGTVYIQQDRGQGFEDTAGPVSIAASSTFTTLDVVDCGFPVKIIGVGADGQAYPQSVEFTPVSATFSKTLTSKPVSEIEYRAFDSTFNDLAISNGGTSTTGSFVTETDTVKVYADTSNTSITVTSGGEFEVVVWDKTQSTVAKYGADGTGFIVVSLDEEDYDETTISVLQGSVALSAANGQDLPGLAFISGDYTEEVFPYKMRNGIGSNKEVFNLFVQAEQGSSAESNVFFDTIMTTTFRGIDGTFKVGSVDDTSAHAHVIEKQNMEFVTA